MCKLKLLVVDDHPMVLEGMQAMLAQIGFVTVTGLAQNARQAITMIEADVPDIVITDINMPETDGIMLTAIIKKEYPAVRVIAMSTFNERGLISQMIQQGASGYMLKSASLEEIEEAIRMVKNDKLYLSIALELSKNEAETINKIPVITSRELEVLVLISDGLTNHQIAEKLFVSPYTVDSHRKNLLTKFGVNNTAGLIKSATKYGMV